MTKHKTDKNINLPFISILSLVLILAVWLGAYFIFPHLSKPEQIGDAYGSINTLFSGLALAGIVITILLQRNELALQREELSETRKEFSTQNNTLHNQRFENTFFQLLKLKADLLGAIYIPGQGELLQGTPALNRIWDNFNKFCKENMIVDLKSVKWQFDQYISNHENVIIPYLDTIYNTMRIIDSADILEKKTYIDLFSAQLSNLDKVLLFYWGAIEGTGNNLKPLIEKYHLLRFLPERLLIQSEHVQFYGGSAYNPGVQIQ